MSLLKKGNEAFKKQDYQIAIDYYQQALVETPQLQHFIEFNLKNCHGKLHNTSIPKLLVKDSEVKQVATEAKKDVLENFKQTASKYEGKLESFNNNELKGWVVKKGEPAANVELKVLVNGVQFCTLKNDQSRGDLQRHKKSKGKGGFSITLASELFTEELQVVEIKLPDGGLLAQVTVAKQSSGSLHQNIRVQVDEAVSVIVPIYNAADDLKVCIERLVKYTKNDIDIILIDDASTDEKIQEIIQKSRRYKNIRIFKNQHNLGFTKTVNRGIELAGANDVVFLNSDARVTPRWLEGLRAALATDQKIATVTPMSDRAGAFSAPNIGNENYLPGRVKEEDYAVAFRRHSIGFYPTVPTGNGFCLYVRRKAINEIGMLDDQAFPRGYGEENDFCMRARNIGWRNVIDDRTYVFHDRNKSFGDAKNELISVGRKIIDERYPDYKKSTAVFKQSPLINLARFRAGLALKEATDIILPRGLFVISTLTGGTPQTNRDLMLAVNDQIEPWLLHCDSKVISFYKVNQNAEDELIKQHFLKEQIEPLTHVSSEYDQVVFNWLIEFDFEFLHIRHLAWHSLNLPKLAKKAGARVIKSFHDYYAICPTIKLLDNERKFCGGACTSSCGECPPELWANDSFPYLKDSWVHKWRDKFRESLKDCDAYITTHESVKNIIIEHLRIDDKKFHVIPHGRDFKQFYQLATVYRNIDVLKILVPGNVNEAKGSKIIEDLLTLDVEGKLEFHILGRVSADLSQYKHPGLILHGEYKRDDFAEHVKNIKPHVGAVLSIWNETWCHTLTELWSVGLPVIVTDYPTVAQRVKNSGAGWILGNNNTENYKYIVKNLTQDEVSQKRSMLKGLSFTDDVSIMSLQYKSIYSSAGVTN